MKVKQAREVARRWMIEEGSGIAGFCGAYTAGSTNWLPEDAELPTAADLDIMVVVAGENQAGWRSKFVYHDTLVEVSYLGGDQLQSTSAEVRRRCAEIERMLPRVCALADEIMDQMAKSRVIDAAADLIPRR
jgi:hypothetical protein